MRDRLLRIAKIAISFLLMYFLLKNIDYSELQIIAASLQIQTILIAILIYNISVILNAFKWHVLLPKTKLKLLVFLCFRSQLYSTILPGQLFGEASKVTLWKSEKEDIMKITASVLFDKITGLIGQVLLAIIGLSFSTVGKTINGTRQFAVIGLLFIGLILVSAEVHVAGAIDSLIAFIKKRSIKLGCKCEDFYNAWRQYSSDRSVLIKSILWGMVNQFTGSAMIWYVSTNMGLAVEVIDYCWIMPVLSFVLLIPISFAGIGLRDASLASMLSIYKVSSGNAVIVSSMLLFGQITSSIIGGIMILMTSIKNKKG